MTTSSVYFHGMFVFQINPQSVDIIAPVVGAKVDSMMSPHLYLCGRRCSLQTIANGQHLQVRRTDGATVATVPGALGLPILPVPKSTTLNSQFVEFTATLDVPDRVNRYRTGSITVGGPVMNSGTTQQVPFVVEFVYNSPKVVVSMDGSSGKTVEGQILHFHAEPKKEDLQPLPIDFMEISRLYNLKDDITVTAIPMMPPGANSVEQLSLSENPCGVIMQGPQVAHCFSLEARPA